MSGERDESDTSTETVDPDDPIFTERPTFESGAGDLSERVDEVLYEDT